MPHLTEIHPSKLEVSLLERFQVSFGVEGGSTSLVCGMVVVPNLPNLLPLAQWYRDGKSCVMFLPFLVLRRLLSVTPHSSTDKLLKPSRLVEMSVGGGVARLTLPHLAKDDEGLYTLRIFTKDGTAEHSAYLFVSGKSFDLAALKHHLMGQFMDQTIKLFIKNIMINCCSGIDRMKNK